MKAELGGSSFILLSSVSEETYLKELLSFIILLTIDVKRSKLIFLTERTNNG